MPERRTFELAVFVNQQGDIVIESPDPVSHDSDAVLVHPAQVELLIEWLREAKEEALRHPLHAEIDSDAPPLLQDKPADF